MKSRGNHTVTGIFLGIMVATAPSAAFVNIAPKTSSSRRSTSLVGNMASQKDAELFQRSLLAAKFKNEGRLPLDSGGKAETSKSNQEVFQRSLLAERLKNVASENSASKGKEKAKQADLIATKIAKEQAEAAAAEAKKKSEEEEKARIAAEKEKEEKIEKERIAAEKEAAEAAEKARIAAEKEAAEAIEKANIAAEKEAAEAAEKAKKEAADKERIATEKAVEAARIAEEEKRLAEEKAALAAKKRAEKMAEIEAAATKELEDLKSRSDDIKVRAKRIADRVPILSGSSNLLPSSDDYSSALATVKKFNPSALKERKESNTELLREVADGMARVVVDGFGTGLDLFEAVREDDDLKSVVTDALRTAKAAVDVLVRQNELEEDDSAAAFQRKARIAFIALDSVGVATYASICGVLGYGSEGPVNESASKAVGGFFNAISAAAVLTVRSADTVVDVTQKVSEEGKDIVEETQAVIQTPAKVVAVPQDIQEQTERTSIEGRTDKAMHDSKETFQRSLLAERLKSTK